LLQKYPPPGKGDQHRKQMTQNPEEQRKNNDQAIKHHQTDTTHPTQHISTHQI